MITKDLQENHMNIFCASDYHLEMILLPYIKEKINNSEFIILTENNLEDTINKLLERVNINEKTKEKIKNLNWKAKDNNFINNIINEIKNDKNINIIINGKYTYIKDNNEKLKNIVAKNTKIINCFHIDDTDVDIDLTAKNCKNILNTKKII